MIDQVRRWIGQRRKAIVGVLVGAAVAKAAAYGIDMTDAQQQWLTVLLTSLSVYWFPND